MYTYAIYNILCYYSYTYIYIYILLCLNDILSDLAEAGRYRGSKARREHTRWKRVQWWWGEVMLKRKCKANAKPMQSQCVKNNVGICIYLLSVFWQPELFLSLELELLFQEKFEGICYKKCSILTQGLGLSFQWVEQTWLSNWLEDLSEPFRLCFWDAGRLGRIRKLIVVRASSAGTHKIRTTAFTCCSAEKIEEGVGWCWIPKTVWYGMSEKHIFRCREAPLKSFEPKASRHGWAVI